MTLQNWGHLTNNNIKLYIHYTDMKKERTGALTLLGCCMALVCSLISMFWDNVMSLIFQGQEVILLGLLALED
jgi:hypothetical protein